MPYSRSEKLSRPSETAWRIEVAGSVTSVRDRRKVATGGDRDAPDERARDDARAGAAASRPRRRRRVAKMTTSVSRVRIVNTFRPWAGARARSRAVPSAGTAPAATGPSRPPPSTRRRRPSAAPPRCSPARDRRRPPPRGSRRRRRAAPASAGRPPDGVTPIAARDSNSGRTRAPPGGMPRCAGLMTPSLAVSLARWMRFCSSRTLPGHSYVCSVRRASSDSVAGGAPSIPGSASRKCSASSSTSSGRSPSGGSGSSMTLRRK